MATHEPKPKDPVGNPVATDPDEFALPGDWHSHRIDKDQFPIGDEVINDYRIINHSRQRNGIVEVWMTTDSEYGEPYGIEARTAVGEMAVAFGTAQAFLAALKTTLHMLDLLDAAEQAGLSDN